MYEPFGTDVLLRKNEKEQILEGGIILQIGCVDPEYEVIALGKGKYNSNGEYIPYESEVALGDIVYTSGKNLTYLKLEGSEYILLKQEEIVAKKVN